MTTFERIKKLADGQKISLKELALKLDMGENAIYSWKKKTPGADKIKVVADYFDVSTDYLLGREEKEEEGFVTFFRANTSDLSDEKKQLLEEELMAFMEARRKFLDGKGK
ncbi:helix-turn-helix transcriptional regulator [Listeria booriae]|uniref:helix-turn-helix domain-containing protein n=1 Tax=Listeria booriae TaxID=1552123 RepID=UPI001624642C|nr:helix-turn-helix transcriptional regulator [Listeria booriae]MBC1524921.1 helix-turn-helix transcriptional regulator [Listeria booriae]MBC6134276.1 helix-turn-helix transcriptional regulator [Listeria booriae]